MNVHHYPHGHKDIPQVIEYLRTAREETPAAAATPSAPQHVQEAAAESIKAAKSDEFPVKPKRHEGAHTGEKKKRTYKRKAKKEKKPKE